MLNRLFRLIFGRLLTRVFYGVPQHLDQATVSSPPPLRVVHPPATGTTEPAGTVSLLPRPRRLAHETGPSSTSGPGPLREVITALDAIGCGVLRVLPFPTACERCPSRTWVYELRCGTTICRDCLSGHSHDQSHAPSASVTPPRVEAGGVVVHLSRRPHLGGEIVNGRPRLQILRPDSHLDGCRCARCKRMLSGVPA